MTKRNRTLKIKSSFFLGVFCLIFIVLNSKINATESIRVGFFEKRPIIFVAEDAKVKGLAVDFLTDIAKEQGWELTFVKGVLSQSLERVMSGEVDLMVPVGYTENRDQKMDFSGKSFFETWGCLYTLRKGTIQSLEDIEGKRIGGVKDSLFNKIFLSMVDNLDISCEFVEVPDYDELLTGLTSKNFDGAVGERLAILFVNTDIANKIDQSIIFNPFPLFIGATEGDPKKLLSPITQYIRSGKSDPNSAFSKHKNYWLSNIIVGTPPFLLSLIFIFILLLFVFTAYLLSRIAVVRSTLGLTEIVQHKVSTNILVITIVLALSLWGTDILVQYYGFGGSITFSEAVFPIGYPQKLFMRFLIIIIVLLAGLLISRVFSRLATQHDITKKQEERLNLALFAANDGLWDWHLDDNTLFFDDRYYTMTGYRPNEFQSSFEEWEKRVHPDDIGAIKNAIENYMSGKTEKFDQKFRFQHKNGDYLWIRSKGKITARDENNMPIRFIGTHSDITQLKQLNDTNLKQMKSLKESEERFRTLHKASFGGIVIHDKGIILDCNQGLSDISGYTFDELIGTNGLRLIAPEWIEEVTRKMMSEAEEPYEAEGIRKDGTKYSLYLQSKLIPYKGRTVRVGELRDITVQKQTEEENASLESQLHQAQKMEAIGTLAGGIAHDFNNILSGIFGYAQLADMNIDEPEKAKDYITQVTVGAKRAAELVQQILTFSRKSEHKKSTLKLYLIIKEATKFLRSSIPATIDIKEKIYAKDKVLANPTQIHQIVMNLCTNAYHAMKKKGGILTVSLEVFEVTDSTVIPGIRIPPDRYLNLKVSDTGSGMTSEVLTKIFEPYFTTKDRGEGTGLGLAVVKGIIDDHNGYVTVRSEIGKGSTFNVYLPVLKNQNDQSVQRKETDIIKGGSESIMVVDDDEAILSLTKDLLKKFGYQVTAYLKSPAALDAFEQHPLDFDLIITDMTMPGITGDDFSYRALKIRKDIPIILCTGYSDNINEIKALDIGIKKYLSKPVESKHLLAFIRKFLDENKPILP